MTGPKQELTVRLSEKAEMYLSGRRDRSMAVFFLVSLFLWLTR